MLLIRHLHLALSKLKDIKVENLRFSPILSFFILSSFPHSAYLCTPLARQPRISARNPFAPTVGGAFRRNRKRAAEMLLIRHLRFAFIRLNDIKVENLRFSPFLLKLFSLALIGGAVVRAIEYGIFLPLLAQNR